LHKEALSLVNVDKGFLDNDARIKIHVNQILAKMVEDVPTKRVAVMV
jgi:hypothetical protein